MPEGIIVKIPTGSSPITIRRQWLFLRFVFNEVSYEDAYPCDAMTGRPMRETDRYFVVTEEEAYRVMDAQRPGMSAFYRRHGHPSLKGTEFYFHRDEIHFLEGTDTAWG